MKIQAKYPAISITVFARLFGCCDVAGAITRESAAAFYLLISVVILLVIYLIAKFAMEIEVSEDKSALG